MYVGTSSLRAVSFYLAGYSHAVGDLGEAEAPLDGWMRWVELRFSICHPAWHWTRILEHHFGSSPEAIKALPSLYREFLAKRAEIGLEGIESEHQRYFIVPQAPTETATTVEW